MEQNSHSKPWSTFVDERFDNESDHAQDLFIERDGVLFAGTHLILDYWGAKHLSDIQLIEKALREAVKMTGSTLLHIHLHHFTPNGGVSGVAVLAESHISIHTWPERDYAALDVFMCGDTEPEKAIAIFENAFEADEVKVTQHQRGVVDPAGNR
ncbi:MAG: adenosylmethionine decarboxylase [Cocleimonas sp.]